MPRPIDNATTADQYTDALTCLFTPSVPSFAVLVSTAAVYYQLAVGGPLSQRGSVQYGPETPATPGRYSFDETDSVGGGGDGTLAAIRFRSKVAGVPAQIITQG